MNLSQVEILVLDEADRMLDMGFIHDIRRILALLPPKRQNLLFSATFADEIKKLADSILRDPALIEVARRNTAAETVTQVAHPVDRERKRELLSHLIKLHDLKQVLVFSRTKHGANRLAQQLERDGIPAAAIHGNKSQPQRTKALADFKAGLVTVLVATDIAARGIDIDQLPHVVNFELPNVPEDYVHRIGRTGRAGSEGDAISLVCVDEAKLLKDIERLLKREIPKEIIPGFEPDPTIAAEPIPNGRNGVRPSRGDDRPRRQEGRPQPRGQQSARPPREQSSRAGQARHPDLDDNRGNRAEPAPQARPNRPPRREDSRPAMPSGNRSAKQGNKPVAALLGGLPRNSQ